MLRAWGTGLLADAVGLGKTYVSLAIARDYRHPVVVVPATLRDQWQRLSAQLDVRLAVVTHEVLSRSGQLPPADLVIVDEAHRFRNPRTNRYRRLARQLGQAHVLLVTATPLVNRLGDLAHLMALALPDHGLAIFGLPSIAQAIAERRYEPLSRAIATLTVARSHHAAGRALGRLPAAADRQPIRTPPVPELVLKRVIDAIDTLRFPNVGDRAARALMRLHLLMRLGSSVPALAATLRRHRGYLDRALTAARRGEALSRANARLTFRDLEAWQLDLDLTLGFAPLTADPESLEQDRVGISALLDLLRPATLNNPKACALKQLLAQRHGGRTIVFTTAGETAMDLARRLEWSRLAVVAGGRARIASGPVSVSSALDLFAPKARRCPNPHATVEVQTLIATDLVSEGLNLQDANAIVHYDLPWSPVRLVQRLGRIARLGTAHEIAHVWWFAPPPALERRIALADRIVRKAAEHRRFALAATSSVGRARVLGNESYARQRLADLAARRRADNPGARFALVDGPSVAAIALEWTMRGVRVPEVLMLMRLNAPLNRGYFERLTSLLARLAKAPSFTGPIPRWLSHRLHSEVRHRLRCCEAGPRDPLTRRLARLTVRQGIRAARERRNKEMGVLDAVLAALQSGVRLGALEALEDLLTSRTPNVADLESWLRRHGPQRMAPIQVRLVAALSGVAHQ